MGNTKFIHCTNLVVPLSLEILCNYSLPSISPACAFDAFVQTSSINEELNRRPNGFWKSGDARNCKQWISMNTEKGIPPGPGLRKKPCRYPLLAPLILVSARNSTPSWSLGRRSRVSPTGSSSQSSLPLVVIETGPPFKAFLTMLSSLFGMDSWA